MKMKMKGDKGGIGCSKVHDRDHGLKKRMKFLSIVVASSL